MDNTPAHPIILMLLDNSFVSDARVEKEAESLLAIGASLTVGCLIEKGLPEEELRDGYKILRIIEDGFNAPMRKTYDEYLSKTVDKILKFDFDILHCHDFYMLSIGAEVKKQRPAVKLIYDAHEYLKGWPFYKTSSGLNKWKGKIVWNKLVRKEKEEIQQADAVVTITNGIAERLKSDNGLNTLPTVIGNYPKITTLKVEEGYFNTKYNLEAKVRVLVHSGTIYHSDTQVKELMNIVRENEELVLVFIGNRPRFYELEEMVQSDDNLKNTVFFHSYPKNQEETINLLGAADFGLLHLNNEWEAHKIGFSNRFVEYIMAGLPVVATPQQFTREFNASFKCSAFYSGNKPTELSKAISEIADNLVEYKQKALAAREKLDWQLEADKLINLYEAL